MRLKAIWLHTFLTHDYLDLFIHAVTLLQTCTLGVGNRVWGTFSHHPALGKLSFVDQFSSSVDFGHLLFSDYVSLELTYKDVILFLSFSFCLVSFCMIYPPHSQVSLNIKRSEREMEGKEANGRQKENSMILPIIFSLCQQTLLTILIPYSFTIHSWLSSYHLAIESCPYLCSAHQSLTNHLVYKVNR